VTYRAAHLPRTRCESPGGILNKRSALLLRQAREKMTELSGHPVLSAYWSQLSLVIKGSTSRGNADRYSDIDLVFYATEELKQAIVAAYHDLGLTDRSDSIFMFFPNGHYHVETFSHLNDCFANRDFIHCWEAEHALVLSDPDGRFVQIMQNGHEQLFTDHLEIIKRAYLDLQLDLDWMRMPIIRADAVATFLHMAKITQSLCRIAYLLDKLSYPPDKWLDHYLSTTRWGRANGKELRTYVASCQEVNTLRIHQPFQEHHLYIEASRLTNEVGRFIAKTYGSHPWLEKWYNYV
jgi:hypothetical protein